MTVVERFLKYVKIDTQSNEHSATSPSSEKQKNLAVLLAKEMQEMGLADVRTDAFGYVYATLPATADKKEVPALGLIAHMDTSPSASGANVNPQIIRYNGGDITLKNGTVIEEKNFSFLKKYVGQDLIVTDGNTLLGADDKAGIAEILSACEYLLAHKEIEHSAVKICFTPDEEIGRGTAHFDFNGFGANTAYTLDGGEVPRIEFENFNAAAATVTVRGVNVHPGSAKNRMKNAILMAQDFLNLLPQKETPAHTEGYEGFFHVHELSGDESSVHIGILIRDFFPDSFEKRKQLLREITAKLNEKWGEGAFLLEITDSYRNMREKIEPFPELIENAKTAFRAFGLEPVIHPVRGGTDGARLSFAGIPCPNLSMGAFNSHGVRELIAIPSMETMVKVIVKLIELQG